MTNRQSSFNNQKTIHVLHIASGDLWAGAEVMLYTLARALHKEINTQVSVVLLNHGMLELKLRDCGIAVTILDESQLNSIQILRQLNRIIAELKPNVIHTHRNKENILGSIAAWYKHRIPSLRTVHGAPEHRPPLYKLAKHLILFLDWLTGRYLQQAIVAVSPDLAKKLELSFPKTKIKVIENGIDIESIIQGASHENSIENNKNNYRIGIAGRLTPVKRVDLFVETAVYLKQHQPALNIDFHIYGDGPLNNALQGRIESLQANDYIHLNGHCENITQQLQTLDALLMTSDHEGLPMILLEAMCLRTPIIAHAVGGIPHLLDQGECGTLVHSHTPQAFAEAIGKLIDQPEKHQQLARQAFKRLQKNYSANYTAAAYLYIYKQICS